MIRAIQMLPLRWKLRVSAIPIIPTTFLSPGSSKSSIVFANIEVTDGRMLFDGIDPRPLRGACKFRFETNRKGSSSSRNPL